MNCYRMRVDRFLGEDSPLFGADDVRMYLDLYRDADLKGSFAHFEEQREQYRILEESATRLGRP